MGWSVCEPPSIMTGSSSCGVRREVGDASLPSEKGSWVVAGMRVDHICRRSACHRRVKFHRSWSSRRG
ncbi:hypothetical protein L1887_22510 [Cichorium endivia]|nr:hypothetical protein L1887_22510 [Cichorium endivia]